MRGGRDGLLGTFTSIFRPNLAREEVRLPGGALHWARCIEAFTEFLSPQSLVPLQIALPLTVYARDLFLPANKNWTSPRMTLESANRQWDDVEGEEASASPCPLRPEVELVELRTPRSREDPKGKALATSLSDQRKKRKLVKAADAAPEKSKLVSSTMSAT